MKNHHKRVLSTAAVLLIVAAASAPLRSWGGIEVDKNVTLPVTIEKTWYRTGKARLFGKAYEQSGTLTVSDAGVDFSSNKGTVNIRRESITKIEWGKLSPDIQNDWVIVRYTDSAGEAIAAFKGALFSGGGKDNLIFSAMLKLLEPKSADLEAPGEASSPE
jgi:hypothetical protein